MATQVYSIHDEKQYEKAGATDLLELTAPPGGNPLYIQTSVVEAIVFGILTGNYIHLSGPTGSAKSSLVEALCLVKENFEAICRRLECTPRPIKYFPIEMAVFETPGELYSRRALKAGATFDEPSKLVESLREAAACVETHYPVIWLREMGRVHSSSVQGGLLNLMTPGEIVLPDGDSIQGKGIAWLADSNYQAASEGTHTLVALDDALRRRFGMNITLDWLPPALEEVVVNELLKSYTQIKVKPEMVTKVVKLGQEIRRYKEEGGLPSIVPPTIYGYLAFLKMSSGMPHLSEPQIALATLLGNGSKLDAKLNSVLLHEAFGTPVGDDEETEALTANLF